MTLPRSVDELERAARAILDDTTHLRAIAIDAAAAAPLQREEIVAVLAAELPLIYAERGAAALLRACGGRVLR